LNLNYRGQPIGRITASFGVALFPDHADDADALVRVADDALYHAKGGGRDQVVLGRAAADAAPGAS
jgi:GGDEF domain-containing protein